MNDNLRRKLGGLRMTQQHKYPFFMTSIYFREQPFFRQLGRLEIFLGRARVRFRLPRKFAITDPCIGAVQGGGVIATFAGWTLALAWEDPVDYRAGIAHFGKLQIDEIFREVEG